MLRNIVVLALLAAFAGCAPDTQPQREAGFVEPGAPEQVHLSNFMTTATAPAYSPSPEAGEASRCGPWEVSEAGMEAILEEMIRRGWTPPSRAAAIASSQPPFGPRITALDPERPASPPPSSSPPQSLPDLPTDVPVETLGSDQPALPTAPPQNGSVVAVEPQPQFRN